MSLAALAAVNYSIIHNTIVFVFIAVLLAHELGHYLTAKRFGAKVRTPIFLPIPFLAVAFTKVSKLKPEHTMKTAFYGPFTGFIATLFFILANLIFNFTSTPALVLLAISELFMNYIGTDGTKYRKAKRSLQCI